MLDNELIEIFRPIIISGLSDYGISNIDVVQKYQPTTEGIPSNPTVFFFKVTDHRYGWVGRDSVWNPNTEVMESTETQDYETTFQVNALVPQSPGVDSGLTASDVVNSVAAILQSESTLAVFKNNDIGILRITDVRNPYFSDDKDRWEADPSFDFVVTHKQIRTVPVPVVDTFKYGIFGV